MKRGIPLKGGDEYDAFTRWKQYISWKPGERKGIKRGFNQRERHVQKSQLKRRDRD